MFNILSLFDAYAEELSEDVEEFEDYNYITVIPSAAHAARVRVCVINYLTDLLIAETACIDRRIHSAHMQRDACQKGLNSEKNNFSLFDLELGVSFVN